MGTQIINAKDLTLDQQTGGTPNMSDTLQGWFQPLSMVKLAKTNINGLVKMVATPFTTRGVWQPMKAQSLKKKPEQQRKWKWFTLHAEIDTPLEPDEIVQYLGEQWRVDEKLDYSLEGYIEYHLVNDFTGSGP